MYMSVLHTCMYVCMYECAACASKVRGGHHVPWNCSSDSCELLCEYWEPYMGPLQKQQVLLITEPPLQPSPSQAYILFLCVCVCVCVHLYVCLGTPRPEVLKGWGIFQDRVSC